MVMYLTTKLLDLGNNRRKGCKWIWNRNCNVNPLPEEWVWWFAGLGGFHRLLALERRLVCVVRMREDLDWFFQGGEEGGCRHSRGRTKERTLGGGLGGVGTGALHWKQKGNLFTHQAFPNIHIHFSCHKYIQTVSILALLATVRKINKKSFLNIGSIRCYQQATKM